MILKDIDFDTNQLIKEYKPKIYDKNKLIVFKSGLEKVSIKSPLINFSRWAQIELPGTMVRNNLEMQFHQEYFDYPESTNDYIEWHLNFSHENLFVAYGGPLFAQDEIQVAEHPVLACLKESLMRQLGDGN